MQNPVKVCHEDNPIICLLFHKVEDMADYAWLLCTLRLILEALLQCTKAQLHLVQQQVGARKCRRKERTGEKTIRVTEDKLKTLYKSISYGSIQTSQIYKIERGPYLNVELSNRATKCVFPRAVFTQKLNK